LRLSGWQRFFSTVYILSSCTFTPIQQQFQTSIFVINYLPPVLKIRNLGLVIAKLNEARSALLSIKISLPA
jgi:hypothetical protein